MLVDIENTVAKWRGKMVEWRRSIHMHPEIGFEEERTSEFVRQHLDSLGIPYKIAAGTGVVGIVEGNSPGPTVAIRADMDALLIQEESDHEYVSKIPGKMHACGHDAHTAILMGVAAILAENRDFGGKILLVFQPAEEFPGGAKPMIEAGVFAGHEIKAFVALHVDTDQQVGSIGITDGPTTAGQDKLSFEVQGKGAHGSQPHLSMDPILSASHLVIALQQLRAREINPLEPMVLSVTKMHGGTAHNIIPDVVTIEGTLRTNKQETRERMYRRMREITDGVAKSTGCKISIDIDIGYPPGYNNEQIGAIIRSVADELSVVEEIKEVPPTMGAEDFFEFAMGDKIPVFMFWLGAANEAKGITSGLHTSTFDIDENALPIGAGMLLGSAFRLLEAEL